MEEEIQLALTTLPCLFANGRPASLNAMNENQLNLFIPHMLRSCKEASHVVPVWWPVGVNYANLSDCTYDLDQLVEVVRKCYEHYDEQLVLEYSASLATRRFADLVFEHAGENLTVVYENLTNTILLVTINEHLVSIVH